MGWESVLIFTLFLASVAFLIFRVWKKRKNEACGNACGCSEIKKTGVTRS